MFDSISLGRRAASLESEQKGLAKPYLRNRNFRYYSANARNELPSQEENRRSPVSKRFNHLMDHLQSNLFIAGQRLNDLTGYSGIEALKRDIEEQGQ